MTHDTKVWRRDIVLYGLIAGTGAALTFVVAGDLPKPWGPWLGISNAVLLAVKAKLSNGNPHGGDPQNVTVVNPASDPVQTEDVH